MGQLVVAILVDPVALDEVLEVQGARQPYRGRERVGGDDVQEGEGEVGLGLLGGNGLLSWWVSVWSKWYICVQRGALRDKE